MAPYPGAPPPATSARGIYEAEVLAGNPDRSFGCSNGRYSAPFPVTKPVRLGCAGFRLERPAAEVVLGELGVGDIA